MATKLILPECVEDDTVVSELLQYQARERGVGGVGGWGWGRGNGVGDGKSVVRSVMVYFFHFKQV